MTSAAGAHEGAGGLASCGIGAIAASGSWVIVATGSTGRLSAADLADPGCGERALGAHGAYVPALLVRGGVLFSGGSDGRVLAWRLGAEHLSVVVGCHRAGVTAMAVAVDGQILTGGHDGQLVSWSQATARPLATHPGGITAAASLASGALVTAGRDGRMLCWRSGGEGGEERPVELRQRRREATLTMAPFGSGELVTASGHLGVVRRWNDLSDGGWPDEVGVHGSWVLALAALDRDRLAAVGGDRVTVWDLRTGREQRIHLDHGMHATEAVALPTGGLAVLGPCGSLRVVQAADLAA
ncbi:MAG: WD40 repeat domain-containing protein [Kineosporiaceae bacterium]